MAAIDLRKERKERYTPPIGTVQLVEVPPMSYPMIDGTGHPNTDPAYAESVAALFAVAPLEGLWWMGDGAAYSPDARENWA